MNVQCVIAGGGPAGMMLGLLLARAGIEVAVLEKHADFFRDFRGDTVHPSTLRIMHELGLLQEFLRLPHSEFSELTGRFGDAQLRLVDFRHIPGPCKFIAMMPQWDLLNFLADRASRYSGFHLLMQNEAVDLTRADGRVTGVVAQTPGGKTAIHADLVVACDGRHSKMRECAQLPVTDIGAPIDVLWMRLSRRPGEPSGTFGNVAAGTIFVALDRTTYYQCALVIPKGALPQLQEQGLERLRERIAKAAPYLADRVNEIASWNDLKLLTVRIDRLERWHLPGLLCIGDAAHAMSPIGGVGINLAIQDAVAAANATTGPLCSGAIDEAVLRRVQKRREFPTRATQALQVFLQERFVSQVLSSNDSVRVPLAARALDAVPTLRSIPAFIVGVGFRPEHVRS
ncbi:MAG TPA: FAD-dependent oxidoreductase [Candidatus Baltobacteraceae bacterium]|nr:FAD-dependent oxidoreductase [Candidatus Baltobacteraceae bacterium]